MKAEKKKRGLGCTTKRKKNSSPLDYLSNAYRPAAWNRRTNDSNKSGDGGREKTKRLGAI